MNVERFQRQEFFCKQPEKSGLLGELDKDLEDRCSLKCHADAPKLVGERGLSQDFREKPCRHLGICVCGCGKNAPVTWMQSNVVALFKPFFRVRPAPKQAPGGPQKQKGQKPVPRLLMEQGMLVFRFTSARPEEAAECLPLPDTMCNWEQTAEALVSKSDVATLRNAFDRPRHVDETIWFHISFANYRDWTFSFLHLEEDSTRAARADNGDMLTVLQVPPEAVFRRDIAAFQRHLNLRAAWKATVYVIHSDSAALTSLDMAPDIVEVKRLQTIPELCIWKAKF